MKKTHKIDAKGKRLGRLASRIAFLLQGKHKPSYKPYLDDGDFVKVANIDKIELSGRKMEQKTYFRHSGYLGHEKHIPIKKIFDKNPGEVLRLAVWNMLPKNRLRKERIKRLKIAKNQ